MPELEAQLTGMTRPVFDQIVPSAIRQFDNQIKDIPGILKLTLGEPDFNAPDHVKQATIDAINQNRSHYAPAAGLPELREAISTYLTKLNQVTYDPQTEILVTVGATEAIAAAMGTVLGAGDEVIIPTPIFPLYITTAQIDGATPVLVDTSVDDYVLTPARLTTTLAVHPRAKMLVLNYPTNPTGVTYTDSQLQALAAVIRKHKLLVLADEIYCELAYDQPHVSISTLLPERTIVINGVSKTFAMTGYRVGYLAAPAALTQQIAKLHGALVTAAPTPMMAAATDALQHGVADTAAMKDQYHERRDFLVQALNQLGFTTAQPNGAFYVFAKIPADEEQDDRAFALKVAQQAKVAVVPGSCFGPGGEGHVRLSYAADMDKLQEAVKRLAAYRANKLSVDVSA